jgi:hypothetical protein
MQYKPLALADDITNIPEISFEERRSVELRRQSLIQPFGLRHVVKQTLIGKLA